MQWNRSFILLSFLGQATSDLSVDSVETASAYEAQYCSWGTCSSDMASLRQRQGGQIANSIRDANQLRIRSKQSADGTLPNLQPMSTMSLIVKSTNLIHTEAVRIGNTSSTIDSPKTSDFEKNIKKENKENTAAVSTPGSKTSAAASTSVACCVTLIGGLLALGVWSLHLFQKDCDDVDCDPNGRSKRSHHLDNTKVIAIFLVILSHLLWYNINHESGEQPSYDDWRTWLSGSEAFLMSVLSGISVVMMPTFCFVSGIVSQGGVTSARIKRFVQNLFLPTLIWIFVAKPVILDTLVQQGTLRENLLNLAHLRSFHQEWYLQAMVLWRGSAFLVWSHLRPEFSLFAMLALSCYAGYVNFGSVWWLQLDPAFGFLPYFAIGYVFPYAEVLDASDRIKIPTALALVFILLWVFVVLPQGIGQLPDGHSSYYSLGDDFTRATSRDYGLFWVRRLAKLLLDMVPTLVLMFFVIPGKQVFFSWLGPHTLFPYLLHEVANYWRNMLILKLPLPHITSVAGHAAVLMLHVPYIMAVIWLCSSSQCRWLFAWCLKPTWLLWFFRPSAPSTGSVVERFPRRQTSPCPELDAENEHHRLLSQRKPQSESDESSLPSTCETGSTQPPLTSGCSKGSLSSKTTSCSRCRPIPWQKDAVPLYPYALPVWLLVLVSMIGLGAFLQLRFLNLHIFGHILFLVMGWIGFIGTLTASFMTYVFHFIRFNGSIELPQACEKKLLHAVVVVSYKEPLEVLTRTCDSIIAQEGLGQPLILLLAMERRDETSMDAYAALTKRYEGSPQRILYTQHPLSEGETKGKSSNENYAVRELHAKLVCDEGMDPFDVLITIVDADSVVSKSYLAHTEASFFAQMDGRRLIYSGPLNCFRNFGDGGPLVQFYELSRCFQDTFWPTSKMVSYYPQSNYSLTLGLCEEIGFWTPDSIPEDIHTANKAVLMRFSQQSTIPIESIICNDLVTDFADRYTQAKRHCFGSVAEAFWICSLLQSRELNWIAFYNILCAESGREGNLLDFTFNLVKTSQLSLLLFLMWQQSPLPWQVHHLIALWVMLLIWRWIMFWVGCLFYWQTLMKQFDIKRASVAQWMILFLFGPLLDIASFIVFYVMPFVHSLAHASFVGDLNYVVAPKGNEVPNEDTPKKPTK